MDVYAMLFWNQDTAIDIDLRVIEKNNIISLSAIITIKTPTKRHEYGAAQE